MTENVGSFGRFAGLFTGLMAPVLHDHGDGRGAATVRRLRYERNVKPDTGRLGGEEEGAKAQGNCNYFCYPSSHEPRSVDRDDDKDQGRDSDKDEEQVAIVDVSGGEITFRLLGATREVREIGV